MKSKFTPLYALFLLTFFLVSNSSNPPDGRTGAPGDGNCTNCHTGNNPNNFEGTILIQGLPDEVMPNANYTIKVVARKAGDVVRAGFQMVVLDDNNQNTGTFSNPDNNAVLKEDKGRNYFEHNPAQSFENQEEVSWTVDWTAPSTANTSINVYVNAIFGNGSGTSGDLQMETTRSSVVVMNVSDPIVATITEQANVSCFGGSDGTAMVSVIGGQTPYSYEWSNGRTEASVNNLPKGNHSVIITDAAGTIETLEVIIEESTPLTIEVISQVNIDCMNPIGLVEVLASGGTPTYQYAWDDIAGAAVSLPVGDQEVTVTDGLGCTQTASVTIEKNVLLPQVNAGSNKALDCKEAFVALEGKAEEELGISYLWTTSDGSILAGKTSLEPIVEAKGIYTLLVSNSITGCRASSQVEVTEDFEAPIANAGTTKQLDCSEPSVVLNGSVNSTSNTLVFQWTNDTGASLNQTSLTPTVSEIGTYTLIVTDTVNGCSDNSSVAVILDGASPMAFAGESQQLDCGTNQATLNGNGSTGIDYVYTWETEDGRIESGATTLNPVVTKGGTYTLTIRNRINGCDASSSVMVSSSAFVEANAGGDIVLTCSNSLDVRLSGITSTRGDNITYEWTTEDGNFTSDNTGFITDIDAVGTYTLTVRDIISGCTATDQVMVTQIGLVPQIEAPAIQRLTCESPTIQLQVTTLEGPEIIYQWITTDGHIIGDERTLNPFVDAPGIYNLGVINTVNGCVNTIVIEVVLEEGLPSARVNASALQLDCTTSSIVLDGSGSLSGDNIFYEWSTVDGNIVEGRTSNVATINAGGRYILAVTNIMTGCSSSYTTDITELDFPSDIILETPPTIDCTNSLVRLSAMVIGDNLTYQWSTIDGNISAAATTLSPLVDAPGAYSLTVLKDGCMLTETVNVIEEATSLEVQLELPKILDCKNSSVGLNVLGNTAQLDFLWSTVDGNIISGEEMDRAVVDAAGSYEVLVIDRGNGCSGSSIIEVKDERLFIILDTIIANSATVLVDGGVKPYTYQWNTEPAQTSVTANNLSDGTYTVTITDAEGCTISTTSTVGVSTSTSDINSLITYDLFPNPTNSFLTIEANFNQSEEGMVNVFNILGKRHWQQSFSTNNLQLVVDVSDWESGVYFIQLETMEGIRVKELVVGK